MPMQVVDIGPERIVLTDGLQPFAYRTPAGTLLLQAQASLPPGYQFNTINQYPGLIATVISRDDGMSWTRWAPTPEQGEGPVTEGAFTTLADGTLLVMNWIAVPTADDGRWGVSLWESNDDFRSVRGPISAVIDLPQATMGYDDGGHPYSGVTFHRSLLALPDGDLLASVYCWFKGDDTPCPYQPRMHKFRTILLRSSDRGRSWRYVSTIAVDPTVGEEGFNEPVIIRVSRGLHTGRLVCLMRTGSNDCAIYQAQSDDNGETWSSPHPLDFNGVDPDMIELADGTLVCSTGRRINEGHEEDRGYYLFASEDAGEHWHQLTKLPPTEPYALTAAGARPERDDGHLLVGDHFTTEYSTVREVAPNRLIFFYDVGRWGHTIRYIASREIHLG